MADHHFIKRIPEGDSLERDVCQQCGFIAYDNPKVVVGAVVRAEGGILMCRRAIEPRRGYWTLPAGFLELRETPEAGAAREAREEANAQIAIHSLLAIYSIPRISQVQIIYRASLQSAVSPGPESEEVAIFAPDAIPWTDIAFPSVLWALDHDFAVEAGRLTAPFSNPPGETGSLQAPRWRD